MQIGNNKPFLI